MLFSKVHVFPTRCCVHVEMKCSKHQGIWTQNAQDIRKYSPSEESARYHEKLSTFHGLFIWSTPPFGFWTKSRSSLNIFGTKGTFCLKHRPETFPDRIMNMSTFHDIDWGNEKNEKICLSSVIAVSEFAAQCRSGYWRWCETRRRHILKIK